jgi:hypothetical protein
MPEIKIEFEGTLTPQVFVYAALLVDRFGAESLVSRSCKVRNAKEMRAEMEAFVAEVAQDGYEVKHMVWHWVPYHKMGSTP